MFRNCSTTWSFFFVVVILALGACTKEVAPGTFVADYAAWVALPDEDAQRKSAVAIVERWKGKTVRWPALALAGLCVPKDGATSCAMNPFPRGGADAEAALALGGVFPLYRFDAAQLAALKQACKGLSTCVVDVDATITEIRLDPDEPLGVWLTASKVNGGRAPADADGWARPRVDPAAAQAPLEGTAPLATAPLAAAPLAAVPAAPSVPNPARPNPARPPLPMAPTLPAAVF